MSEAIDIKTVGDLEPGEFHSHVVILSRKCAKETKRQLRTFLAWLLQATPPGTDGGTELAAIDATSTRDNANGAFANEWNADLELLLNTICSKCDAVTIVIEGMHVDPSFRDVYYYHYSRQFFNMPRYCTRLTLFDGDARDTVRKSTLGNITKPVHGCSTAEKREFANPWQCRLIGSIVLTPLPTEHLGRTLVDPAYLLSDRALIRLSSFETTMRGIKLVTRAFPYRSQDGIVMTCAEISLLNLLCYYSNEYNEYAVTLPSEILEIAGRYAHERVTPSRGMSYFDFSKILFEKGFYPRLYSVEDAPSIAYSGYTQEKFFRHILHWYVNSGIPVAVNVSTGNKGEEGHSLICIGYAPNARPSAAEMRHLAEGCAYRCFDDGGDGRERSCTFMDSADFESRYVVIDDSQLPYAIRNYEQLSRFPRMVNEKYAVALHRNMTLDAIDAHDNFIAILTHPVIGVMNWAHDYLDDDAEVVMRMFMASTRRYKRARVQSSEPIIGEFYANTVFPHFVWVMELYTLDSYAAGGSAFGEVVLDGTAGRAIDPTEMIVLMRYPNKFVFRSPEEPPGNFSTYVKGADDTRWTLAENAITPFDQNLSSVKSKGGDMGERS